MNARSLQPSERETPTAGEYRRLTLIARRWMNVCLDAGELDEAKRLLEEAARYARLADEIEHERRAGNLPSYERKCA